MRVHHLKTKNHKCGYVGKNGKKAVLCPECAARLNKVLEEGVEALKIIERKNTPWWRKILGK